MPSSGQGTVPTVDPVGDVSSPWDVVPRDGEVLDFRPGDVAALFPGRDRWKWL